ncbi:hypothetical protein [Sphingosinicella terrae]|uniref:hypothetical protein n=1 Tax=Sphingosinicella terrae TaxID=2172047 RepID=UPI000E0DA4BA|nr:hypothetical protein [Sphingosinicella terrae]
MPARPRIVCDPLFPAYMHDMGERKEGMAEAARQQRSTIATLWLILAAIFAHALLPVGSPIERISGSAFSAATSDVSLAPGRALAAEEEDTLGDLDGPAPAAWPDPIAAMSAVPQAPMPQQPFLAGLPASPPGARPYAPRAPPLS